MRLGGQIDSALVVKIVLSAVVLLAALGFRAVVVRVVARNVPRLEMRRRLVVGIRNGVLLVAIAALIGIWAEALRTVAVSFLALAVALAIVTKELLQSILASALKAVTDPFSIGDRIEIGGFRGDVVDQTLLTTTLLEVGGDRSFHMRTGRKVTFPNLRLLDSYVVNESYAMHYLAHSFAVPLEAGADWRRAERVLLEAARATSEPFLEEAKRSMRKVEETHGLDVPVEPGVQVQLSDARLTLLVRVPVPVGQQANIEQAIIREFLEEFHGPLN